MYRRYKACCRARKLCLYHRQSHHYSHSGQLIAQMCRKTLFSTLIASSLFSLVTAQAETTKRPNVVFILADDQDARLDSLDFMPSVQKHLIEKGTHFQKHYCTVAVCCPSRVSLWTGKTAHNTNVTNVAPPYGEWNQPNS